MSREYCPECHQPITEAVSGVRLSAFKVRLFNFIDSHPGQSSADLAQHFYCKSKGDPAYSIRAHIYQINDALMNTGVKIRGHQYAGYSVERRK